MLKDFLFPFTEKKKHLSEYIIKINQNYKAPQNGKYAGQNTKEIVGKMIGLNFFGMGFQESRTLIEKSSCLVG